MNNSLVYGLRPFRFAAVRRPLVVSLLNSQLSILFTSFINTSTLNWFKYHPDVLLAINLCYERSGETHMPYVLGLLHKLAAL